MRILLAMRENTRRENLRLMLEGERSDLSVFTAGDGRSALPAIQSLEPEALVLDHVLSLLDGPAVLGRLRAEPLPCPPKVIFLCVPGQESLPAPEGTDLVLPGSASPAMLAGAVRALGDILQGALALLQAPARSALIQHHFRELGMPEGLKGRSYLAFLLDLVIPSPPLLDGLTARLYPAAAKAFATTPAAVERCIRHALEATWSRGDMAALERLFGLSIDPDRGKPTTREFLAMSAQHLRRAPSP